VNIEYSDKDITEAYC